jgi:hypothetical protein
LYNLLSEFVTLLGPASFFEALNIVKLELLLSLLFTAVLSPLEPRVHLLIDHLIDLRDYAIPLQSECLRDIHVVDVPHNLALHHGAAIVVLDVALPSGLRHVTLLIETLLLEKLCRIVVRVGQEILEALFLGMIFESVHQPCA